MGESLTGFHDHLKPMILRKLTLGREGSFLKSFYAGDDDSQLLSAPVSQDVLLMLNICQSFQMSLVYTVICTIVSTFVRYAASL